MYKIKAAAPRKMANSESVERLIKLKKNFAIRPYLSQSERWEDMKVARTMTRTKDGERKKLIRDMDNNIKGVDFAAQEMAKIIRSWMSQEEK